MPDTVVDEYIKRIDESVTKAANFESALIASDFSQGKWCVSWKGVQTMHDVCYLHLMNNLCSYPNVKQLHVGFFQGGSLLPCFEGGNAPRVYAIDNFFGLQHEGGQENLKIFLENTFRLGHQGKFTLFPEDCYTFDNSKIQDKINFHVYDADHSEESQFLGIDRFHSLFDDIFILLVDDFKMNPNREAVSPAEHGTRRAIAKNGYRIHYEKVLEGPLWFYGHGLFVLEKPKS